MNSQPLMEVAKGIANRQGRLARSPAELDGDGTIVLCAASCIAKAAIMLNGDLKSLAEFEERIIYEDKNTYIGNIFKARGVDMDAERVLLENDTTAPERRLEWFNRL